MSAKQPTQDGFVPETVMDAIAPELTRNYAEALLNAGAKEVSAYITHGVLSGGAVSRISASRMKELVITDSIQPTQAVKLARNIRVVGIAPLLGEAIGRTATESSVSSLFT